MTSGTARKKRKINEILIEKLHSKWNLNFVKEKNCRNLHKIKENERRKKNINFSI